MDETTAPFHQLLHSFWRSRATGEVAGVNNVGEGVGFEIQLFECPVPDPNGILAHFYKTKLAPKIWLVKSEDELRRDCEEVELG